MYLGSFKSQDLNSSASTGIRTSFGLTRSRRTTRTLEAFSEAVDVHIRLFDSWCSAEEEQLSLAQAGAGPPLVCSLLNLRSRIEDAFSNSFEILLRTLREIVQQGTRSHEPIKAIWTFPDLPKRMHPAAISTLLLNCLLQDVQDSAATGNNVTLEILLSVLCASTAPCWNMVHRWLKEGMPIRDTVGLGMTPDPGTLYLELDEEFFIEDNELVLLDPDFWTECFALRDSHLDEKSLSVPEFLIHIAPHILAAGKAIGLLRTLGMPSTVQDNPEPWLHDWKPFGVLTDILDDKLAVQSASASKFIDFPKLVYDKLFAVCSRAQQMLSQLLMEDCDVWVHLTAVEDLYLMRRGDVMSNFLDVLFSRMDSAHMWTDFHFLNTAFADVTTGMKWIDPALVRFSYRGSKEKAKRRSVCGMEGLQIEYAVPFPLTYIWGPRALQIYSSIFVFVLQIHRAKSTLERILVRNALPHVSSFSGGGEMKMFYAMRGKFSWFIK